MKMVVTKTIECIILNFGVQLELGGLHEQNKNIIIEEMKAPKEHLR